MQSLGILDENIAFSCNTQENYFQDFCQDRQECVRPCKILPSISRERLTIVNENKQQAGTGPNRRHIQGSKIAKRLPSVKYSLLQYSKIENFTKKIFSKKLHTQKMDRVARRVPLARAPGALKGRHFQNCQHFCRS